MNGMTMNIGVPEICNSEYNSATNNLIMNMKVPWMQSDKLAISMNVEN